MLEQTEKWFKTWYSGPAAMIGIVFFWIIIPAGIIILLAELSVELAGGDDESNT